jgi:hypothetical protein
LGIDTEQAIAGIAACSTRGAARPLGTAFPELIAPSGDQIGSN